MTDVKLCARLAGTIRRYTKLWHQSARLEVRSSTNASIGNQRTLWRPSRSEDLPRMLGSIGFFLFLQRKSQSAFQRTHFVPSCGPSLSRVKSSRVLSYGQRSVGQSFLDKALIWGLRPDFNYCRTAADLLMWGALYDERTGLPFRIAACPRQRCLSRVQVKWNSRPYFTVSDSILPFLSPSTTRKATVEVFDPALTRDGCPNDRFKVKSKSSPLSQVESSRALSYDGRSVGQFFLEWSTHLGFTNRTLLLPDSCVEPFFSPYITS
jgi:hypothetical protein